MTDTWDSALPVTENMRRMAEAHRAQYIQPIQQNVRPFRLTKKQVEANRLMGRARHLLLRGGSRSGKTFIVCRANVVRACKASESSHAILRLHFNHLKHTVIYDTMPKVMRLCFPQLPPYEDMLNKSDWFLELPNGSRILFGGLDDKERTEKVLGQEHSTITLDECSQISYASRNKLVTRLAQNSGLDLRAFYMLNPTNTAHWTYKMFIEKVEPLSGKTLGSPDNYRTILMNPEDNRENLPLGYIDEELAALPAKDRKRFKEGEYAAAVQGALWTLDLIEKSRVAVDQLPEMQRITVNIDPSGCSGPEATRSDEVGLTVTGLGKDKRGYLLEDRSGRHSPERWGQIAVQMYQDWKADTIIGEINFGGDMVRAVVHAANPNVPFKMVTASRGKTQRAEPVSSLYAQGKISHLEELPELEGQLCEFSTAGYQGETSPDRADSAIWGFTELMIVAGTKYDKSGQWM